ncbi:hypothetical protein AMAG_08978 [Allomyces macrogynus ATCC 38327]|uniref:DUF202 domain-containing protein n=1 Tax=Allomyces macrogynus (strain ATCC 38327) TaxID=578462 RepID=A0A0L0SNG0_ALLM3|nr:hypothetical protein AMAG_08978 [Allomyces macrogynus ATCC 38327]|eukprot:KNE63919.1 hypothetical protein AMAG_08978 [Allomyces macrogynus ATCC 38327]
MPAVAPSSSGTTTPFIRVEPKVFFANERTFLSWLNFSVTLGALAVGLLNFGSDAVGRVSGVLFTVIAMAIMLYALYLYLWRAHMIRKRDAGPYDTRIAPVFIVIALFAAVCVNFGLRLTAGVGGAPNDPNAGAPAPSHP